MDFSVLLPGQILFGPGRLSDLPQLISSYGKKVLLVTGRSSFPDSEKWPYLSNRLNQDKIVFEIVRITGEPSPAVIDDTAREYRSFDPDVVVSIGGGSVLDAGKAISAMIPVEGTIRNYLEGVGDGSIHSGEKIPFIAIPTTAGTGSEATKNAVISEVGANGFKKSLRHNNFIPDVALVDAELTLSSPEHTTAWSGMDAFTQLLESYLSTTSNPMTDAIAWSGLEHISQYLERVVEDGSDLVARTGMAYAAMCSGITLANAGLGVIHGFASSIKPEGSCLFVGRCKL